jgi:nitrite reductase (NADH) small subunit
MNIEKTYHKVCNLDEIPLNTGVCALVEGRQVAIYRVGAGNSLYALDNYDPFSRANVLSRGIVGSKGGVPKVASPVYKQQFSLETGECLDDPATVLKVYPVRQLDGAVFVGA